MIPPVTYGDSSAEANTSAAPFAITDRSYIPPQRYFNRTFFELENEKLWPHVWQMACRLEEIPNVGDYVEYWVASYSVIVVRSSPTEIKAYQNACRHRGTQLAQGCGSFRGAQIVCPFHAWRWNLDGSPSLPMYGSEGFEDRVMRPDDLRLVECRVGTWAGCVFINMDLNAPPLLEALHPVPDFLDPLLIADMRVDWWKAVRLKANWKLALEAFMEGWHVRGTHTQLTLGAGDDFRNPHDLQHSYENGHASLEKDPNSAAQGTVKSSLGLGGTADPEQTISYLRMVHEQLQTSVLAKDLHVAESLRTCPPEQFSKNFVKSMYAWNAGAGIKLPDPDPAVLGLWSSQWFIFPSFKIHPLFGNAITYRSRPDRDDPEYCYFEMWSLTLQPEGHDPGKPKFDGVFEFDDEAWPLIARQDFGNIERQQRGLHMPGLKSTRLARKWEDGIANSHIQLDRYLAR
ncbi:aromatic ring-hydroxylating dioxygenase subunit alpha [Pseudofrankia sp. BMG5.37]|nr:aromatic ring-hydroxylating dioxygenase subunit alpha [Pseudofrankia sp. BMG5.36]MDT3442208.1 aromatic ring-hydroxylating dioxygenase subunit alpha [Pseudofrankia sp. BMG5.37]